MKNYIEAKAYNVIIKALGSQYVKLQALREKHGTWQKAWEAIQKAHHLDIEKEWGALLESGVELRLIDDPDYPTLLKEVPWPPFGIYIKGSHKDNVPAVGIVGTRKATTYGRDSAHVFGKVFASRGVTVVSGLALGIDEAAHSGVVEEGGYTIAVLACGLDTIYPRQNMRLAERILENGGCLISEYPIGAESFPNRFIERNRIISGLSQGVVVIEAPEKSGALATARFALDQNRDVFVLPGLVSHMNYRGSHALIRAGARLVASPDDVMEDLAITTEPQEKQLPLDMNEQERYILEVLKKEGKPLDADALSKSSALSIPELTRHLTFLTLKGIVKERSGKYYL